MSTDGFNPVVQVVWLKRDLRIADHAPLTKAALAGAVVPLVVVESAYWQLPDTSDRQYAFWRASVDDVGLEIQARGGTLSRLSFSGEDAVCEALELALQQYGVFHLWSHQETGNGWTYARDKRVARWCKKCGVEWTQLQTFGVMRGPRASQDGSAAAWNATMRASPSAFPKEVRWAKPLVQACASDDVLPAPKLLTQGQVAGRQMALHTLRTFLKQRGERYTTEMSSPISAAEACSRLSVYLAYGAVSVREVAQAAWARLAVVERTGDSTWTQSIRSFISRLHWHCHFIQKLEREPAIETTPMSKACEHLRTRPGNSVRLQAWAQGLTGYPFIDATMRFLHTTGWLNFRMRAMLMSFATYDLWLPWQEAGLVLARLFVDYEPGIHWSQCQMQSGETGMNTLRMYSPVKQALDHDASGAFTRQWVPELLAVPLLFLHEPWTMTAEQRQEWCAAYPPPIVDHRESVRFARREIERVRRTPEARAEASKVYLAHGSRKRQNRRPSGRRPPPPSGLF